MGLFSDRSQKTSKCGKNINDTLSCALCARPGVWQHGIPLFNCLLSTNVVSVIRREKF